jgi:Zn finger protein HypA/HybF involved in hydrogenase expression
MADSVFKFTCYNCGKKVEVSMSDVIIIEHKASACACEYCGFDAWTEWRATCPECDAENDNI